MNTVATVDSGLQNAADTRNVPLRRDSNLFCAFAQVARINLVPGATAITSFSCTDSETLKGLSTGFPKYLKEQRQSSRLTTYYQVKKKLDSKTR